MSEQDSPSKPDRYWAFISYSHADERWASWLHRALETYRLPRDLAGGAGKYGELPPRLFPVFRDREELASAADLPVRIREALTQSRALVVICSPRASTSRWVAEEIRAFKAMYGEERVYCLIVDGEPHASDLAGRDAEECFPEPIRYRVRPDGELTTEVAEPMAADARPVADGRRVALLKLLAGLFGVELDGLRRREEQRRRRRNQGWGLAASLLIALLSTGLWYVNVQRHEAEHQRDLARSRQQVALARQLAAQSARIRVEQPASIELASLLAIEAVRRLDTLETQQALQAALHLLPQRPVRLADGFSMATARYSLDGRIALADSGDTLSAFSVQDGRLLWRVAKHYDSGLLLAPDGCCVLVAEPDRHWRVLHLADGNEVQPAPAYLVAIQKAPTDRVRPLEFSPDGRLLVIGSQLLEIDGDRSPLGAGADGADIVFDPSNRLFARLRGHAVTLLDRTKGEVVQRLELAREAKLHFSPDGALLVALGYQRLEVFDTHNSQRLFELACDEPYNDVAFLPDATMLVTACGNAARLHDARTGSFLADLPHDRPVASVRVSRDGANLLTASYDNTVRLWRLSDRREVWRAAHSGYMTRAEFAPDERSVLAAGMGGIVLWPLAQDADLLAEIPGSIWALAASPDSRWLVAGGVEPQAQVVLVQVADGQSREMMHPSRRVVGLAFSPDSTLLAVASHDALDVFPVTGGDPVLRRRVADYPYSAIIGTAFTPDGQVLIATAGKSLRGYFRLDRCALAGDGEQARCTTRELPLDPFAETQAFFSVDGRQVVVLVTQMESSLRVWDTLGTGETILPPQRVNDLILAPDLHSFFLAHTAGGAVGVLDEAGRTLRTITHEGWVYHLALAQSGQYLAAGLADPVSRSKNRVVLWDVATGEELARYARPGDDGPLVFLPDGRRLAYSDGRRLRLVTWRTDDIIAQACARLSRNLECDDWRVWLRDETYRPTCPNLEPAGCEG